MASGRLKVAVVIAVSAAVCSCDSSDPVRVQVSLVQLIVSPEKHVGGRVIVSGYLDETPSGWFGLYLAPEFAKMHDIFSSVIIADPQFVREARRNPHCRGVFVWLDGTFGQTVLGSPGIVHVEGAFRFNEEWQGSTQSCWLEPQGGQQ